MRRTAPVTLGRTAEADLQLADGLVSRVHARIEIAGSGARIEDLNSRNGTLLNGEPIRRHRLRVGDEITLGSTRIVFNGTGTWT